MGRIENLFIIVLSVGISSTAHVLLRRGMSQLKTPPEPDAGMLQSAYAALFSPWIIGGITLHVLALLVWLIALRRVEITYAYPFLMLGFVLVGVLSYYWLGEDLSWWRIASMVIISIGLLVLAFEPIAEMSS